MLKLPTQMTQVTTLSKTLALILFIILPFLGFYLGTVYQKNIEGGKDSNNFAEKLSSNIDSDESIKNIPEEAVTSIPQEDNSSQTYTGVITSSWGAVDKIAFKYLPSWTVESGSDSIIIKKGEYSINFTQVGESELCIFENREAQSGVEHIFGDQYSEINGISTYRRTIDPILEGRTLGYHICQSNLKGGYWLSFGNNGSVAIWYSVPQNPDGKTLSEMDDIIKTFELN